MIKMILTVILTGLLSCSDPVKTKGSFTEPPAHDSLAVLKQEIDSLHDAIKAYKEETEFWFSETEAEVLKKKGITNPEKFIKTDLRNNSSLIPYPAALGGTMRFNSIMLLGDRWAAADFDDGHIDGRLFLKYSIKKDSSIKWTVVDHYSDYGYTGK